MGGCADADSEGARLSSASRQNSSADDVGVLLEIFIGEGDGWGGGLRGLGTSEGGREGTPLSTDPAGLPLDGGLARSVLADSAGDLDGDLPSEDLADLMSRARFRDESASSATSECSGFCADFLAAAEFCEDLRDSVAVVVECSMIGERPAASGAEPSSEEEDCVEMVGTPFRIVKPPGFWGGVDEGRVSTSGRWRELAEGSCSKECIRGDADTGRLFSLSLIDRFGESVAACSMLVGTGDREETGERVGRKNGAGGLGGNIICPYGLAAVRGETGSGAGRGCIAAGFAGGCVIMFIDLEPGGAGKSGSSEARGTWNSSGELEDVLAYASCSEALRDRT